MSFDPTGGLVAAITQRTVPAAHQITAAECYDLAGKSWMPATAAEAFVRAARTIEQLERGQ